jgi:dTDP-4-dehydrorhamnose reductase
MRTVLVLGATGMLGSMVMRVLSSSPGVRAIGAARSAQLAAKLPAGTREWVVPTADLGEGAVVEALLASARPDVIVNCVGIVKQLASADDPLVAIPVNALLPHRLAKFARSAGARLVHISTDCVFSGRTGNYREADAPDAEDLYGRSKLLGEVDYPNAVTLRTSIIGHELEGAHGLLEWFLRQEGPVNGFRKAIFSGLPTVELATVIRDCVIPRPELRGVYHVSAQAIDKHALLGLIAAEYGKATAIRAVDTPAIDRSLDSTRFREATGYRPAAWPELIRRMREFG